MIHQPFLEQCSYGQFKEHGTGYQECHGSGIPEQGTEKEREQTRNQREGTDHSGLSSRLFVPPTRPIPYG